MSACPLLVVRPEPGNAMTVAAAQARGLAAIAAPLFRIEPVAWSAPPAGRFDAIVFGSANAIRHGGPGLASYAGLPCYAVGEITALAAREAGFISAGVGDAGLAELLTLVANDGRKSVLRLAGEEHLTAEPPPELRVETVPVYAARPLSLPCAGRTALRGAALVLLHSAVAARHFAALCEADGIDRDKLALACLGPRITEAAGAGWRAVRAARRPDDAALLALADEMCQSL